jgi:mxaJ protein
MSLPFRRQRSSEKGRAAKRALRVAVVSMFALPMSHGPRPTSAAHPFRVCSDPANLPYANQRGEGFENALASLIARDLGARVEYTWWSQRRGFIRNTLNAGRCDVVMGVPTGLDMVLRTQPYYRSSYEFVTRRSFTPPIVSFDDPRLRRLSIGVQMIGDDADNSPPAIALARRGITANVHGYMVFGRGDGDMPGAEIMDAVAHGDVDVAVVWGPIAGYYASRHRTPLRLTPVSPQIELPFLPFVFDIAIGVRRGDSTFRAQIDTVLTRRRPEIDRLLARYGVPIVGATRRSS